MTALLAPPVDTTIGDDVILLDRPRSFVPDVDDDVTRRRFLGGAVATLALAGCGTDRATTPDALPAEGAFPVTISHEFGDTVIPTAPTRVVSVGYSDQDAILALGLVPVGVRDWFGDQPDAVWPWAQPLLGGASPEVLPVDALNFEAIAALQPDLIIGWSAFLSEDDYEILAGIAPTTAGPVQDGQGWREKTREFGRMLGRSERADELVAGVEARFAQARAENPGFAGASAIAVLAHGDGSTYVLGPDRDRSLFLTELGFVIPERVATLATENGGVLSDEQLGRLDGVDLLLWVDESMVLAGNSVYQGLDVVAQGRDVLLEVDSVAAGAVGFGSVLSLPVAVDELVPMIAAAVDGDPATEVAS